MNAVNAHGLRKYAVVDLSADTTTVYASPCRLWGVYVNTVLSAAACPIKDGTTTIASLISELAAGSSVDFHGLVCETSLVIDPDDAATGAILVIYEPLP